MKAVLKYAGGEGNVDVREVEEPRCGDNQVKVEVAFCGICGTDLHVMHDTFRNYPPVILGHEMSGIVVEVGKNVDATTIGKRITALGATAVTCGQCRYCLSGNFIFCSKRRGIGHGVNGAFTKYIVLRPDQLFQIPDSFSLEEAALSEPFAAAVQAVTEISPARLGDVAVVSGPGPIGLLCLKLLVAAGVATIVAGAPGDEERLQAALKIGAVAVVNVGERKLREVVDEYTKGMGADVAFECAGHHSSVRGCIEALRPMGHYTQVAINGREIQFPIDQIFYKQLTMNGSICYTVKTWEKMMQIYAQGKLKLSDLITDKLPISEWQQAFRLVEGKKAIKVLMYPEV